MIGLFPDDGLEPPYEELVRQQRALRLEIATIATDRARLEYERSRVRKGNPRTADQDRDAAVAVRYTEQMEAFVQLERSLREREERLTRRIHERGNDPE
jgi:hypothetical protein